STQSTNKSVMENPKKLEMEQLHKQIETLQNKKFALAASITSIKERKEQELKASTGFLDELTLLHDVVTSSSIGLFVYLLLLFFFLAIDLTVLVMMLTDSDSQYDCRVRHQTDICMQMLETLRIP